MPHPNLTPEQIANAFVEQAAELARREEIAKRWEKLKPLVKKLHDLFHGKDAPGTAPTDLLKEIAAELEPPPAPMPASPASPAPSAACAPPPATQPPASSRVGDDKVADVGANSSALIIDLGADQECCGYLSAWAGGNRGMRHKIADRLELLDMDDEAALCRGIPSKQSGEINFQIAAGKLQMSDLDFAKPSDARAARARLEECFGKF